jgi:hypothetical protein
MFSGGTAVRGRRGPALPPVVDLGAAAGALVAGVGCEFGTGRRISDAGLSSRNPSYTTWRSRFSSVQVRNLTSATSSGRTQCTRLSTKGEPNRLVRGGGTSSGISSVTSGCSRRRSRASSSCLMPVPARPA